jgi:hypothetical protein
MAKAQRKIRDSKRRVGKKALASRRVLRTGETSRGGLEDPSEARWSVSDDFIVGD